MSMNDVLTTTLLPESSSMPGPGNSLSLRCTYCLKKNSRGLEVEAGEGDQEKEEGRGGGGGIKTLILNFEKCLVQDGSFSDRTGS